MTDSDIEEMEVEDEDISVAELEKQLRKKKQEAEKRKDIDVSLLEEEIKNFLQKERQLLLKRDILSFWNERKNHKLFDLATVLLAIPFAQVSVERLFSILKFIHNSYRARLGSEILNDIMFLNANFGRLY